MTRLRCALLLFLWFSGCAAEPRYASPGPVQRVGRVYMFRGWIGAVSLGLDQFMRELRGRGFRAEVYENVRMGAVAAQIERAHASGLREPVVIIGYSSGVQTALALSRRLARSNIPVDLLITLDPSAVSAVPPNVRVCVNYYESVVSGLVLFSGAPLTAPPPVQLENIKVDAQHLGEGGVNHFTLDQQRQVKARIVAQLEALCPPRATNY